MPPKVAYLTITSLKEIWEKEFLPSIKEEIHSQLESVRDEIKTLSKKCRDIEKSQDYLSKEFDNFKESLQTTKKHITEAGQSITKLEGRVEMIENSVYDQQVMMDSLQQYQRRDCIEITGVPVSSDEDPKRITVEVGQLMGIDVSESHISIAHRLPATRKVPNRIIAKFVHRDKKDEFYKRRSSLSGKKSKDIPCIANGFGQSIHESNAIYIIESLTPYRRKLFGKVNEFKRSNKWKRIWTVNGKIMLRHTDDSKVMAFTTFEEFEEFRNQTS